jgi:hypothetical protein
MSPEAVAARQAIKDLEEAIVSLLKRSPDGLTNAEIARELGIETGEPGQHRNMLTWALVGRLERSARVERVQNGRRKLIKAKVG